MSQNNNKSQGMRKKLLLTMALAVAQTTDSQAIWIIKNGEAKFKSEVPDLQKYVNDISRTLPVWDDLAARKKVMEEKLNPQLQSVAKDLDSLSDMTDMEAAKIGGETIKKINNVVDTPYIGQESKEFVVDRIRREGNDELENVYQKKFATDYINSMPTAKTIAQIVSPFQAPQFQQNLDPHPHTYVENGLPAHSVGIINPITDAGPLFLSEQNKKQQSEDKPSSEEKQTMAQKPKKEPKGDKGKQAKAEKEVEAALGGDGADKIAEGAPVPDAAVDPEKADKAASNDAIVRGISHPTAVLPVTTVHTRYQIANDMMGDRIDPFPSAIQQATAGSSENIVGQLAPTGGLEQKILHSKAAYYNSPMKDWRHDATRAMDDYYTEKYAQEKQPVVKVEYSHGPVIFRTPTLAEADKDNMAESIRSKVEDLNSIEETKKQLKIEKEVNIIKDALTKYT